MEAVIHFLGTPPDAFLQTCRWWLNEAICHPLAFRLPVEAWRRLSVVELDEQLSRLREPPAISDFEDPRLGLEHAEEELRLTELAMSFPLGVTVVLLRFARRLSALLRWVNSRPTRAEATGASCRDAEAALLRRRYLRSEVEEFQRCAALLADTTRELRRRLPDPELPIRWAQWFSDACEIFGFPEGHCKRYRSQREQVAQVWANNRRTFLSADEHVGALVECLSELDDLWQQPDDEVLLVERATWHAPACHAGVSAGVSAVLRRARRWVWQL